MEVMQEMGEMEEADKWELMSHHKYSNWNSKILISSFMNISFQLKFLFKCLFDIRGTWFANKKFCSEIDLLNSRYIFMVILI